MRPRTWMLAAAAALPWLAACGDARENETPPAAATEPDSPARLLQAEAAMLQIQAPLQPMGIHLATLHVVKDDPKQQMEAHLYCNPVNDDFTQCLIFDSDSTRANLIGVEYIISAQAYEQLPEAERSFWHPHNHAVLSATMVAPDMPAKAELAMMRRNLNSYGKAFHFWSASNSTAAPQAMPIGAPRLAWSLNAEGEADAALMRQFADNVRIDLAQRRNDRAQLAQEADALKGAGALEGDFDQQQPAPRDPTIDSGADAALEPPQEPDDSAGRPETP